MKRTFTAIRSEGGLLPGDLLARIGAGDKKLPGTDEQSYGLLAHETLGEAVNRAWSRLLGAWRAFKVASERLSESDRGTTLTRERWLLPLFHELGYGRLSTARAVDVDGRSFAVSHAWEKAPIHLVSFRFDLDKRAPGEKGASDSSPHGLLQDLLNRSDAHLWGFVTNGLVLRVLRDHHSMTRKAYVEFDLAQIFEGELYSEFRVLWLVAHSSRVQGDKPSACALERWFEAARSEGVAALKKLREGVKRALVSFGTGFLRHQANKRLRDDLAGGTLTTRSLYRQLLRLAYRLIFVFVAEDRGVLLDPNAPREARERFARFYATRRLRDLADQKRGGPHGDLWVQLRTTMAQLYEGYAPLALPAFGSFLWSPAACPALSEAELSNEHLLAALRELCTIEESGTRRAVAWNLVSADELGGVYEALMELHPVVRKESDRETFALETAPGHERKTTGSYYTPTSLVDCLLDTALDPVLDEAARKPEPEQAILELKVVDPACGSGHFLVAAARRIAERLARVRTGDAEPAPRDYQHALRKVVGSCIYGVDLNEMAVELCKVALWMEAIEPGKPLSFLDAHIQHGNALLGATPKLLTGGVPDDAWSPITGDDKEIAKALKKCNRSERTGQGHMHALWAAEAPVVYDVTTGRVRAVEQAPDGDLTAVRAKESAWRRHQTSPEVKDATFQADLWCAAFVWPKDRDHEGAAPTHGLFRRVRDDASACPADTRQEVKRLAHEYLFFHWHIAFPAVFSKDRGEASEETGWHGGFDVVLGNPPWDMNEIKDNEFFSTSYPKILAVKSAKDKADILIEIASDSPALWREYAAYVRQTEGLRHSFMTQGRFALAAVGRLNLYRLFLENNTGIASPLGRVGIIVPSGFVSESFSQGHFVSLHRSGRLTAFYDFENAKPLFESVHRSFRFALLIVGPPAGENHKTDFVFRSFDVGDLQDRDRHVPMGPADLAVVNPLTSTAPTFRSSRDRAITVGIHANSVIFADESAAGWGCRQVLMFMMNAQMTAHKTADELSATCTLNGATFIGRGGERWLPFYEGKMVGMYDHRAAGIVFDETNRVRRNQQLSFSDVDHADPRRYVLPLFWIPESLPIEKFGSASGWHIAVKDVTSATNWRTCIVAVLPAAALTDSVPWIVTTVSARSACTIVAALNSIPVDFVARQKVGGLHLRGHYLAQLPLPRRHSTARLAPWDQATLLEEWIRLRVVELSFTAWDLEAFARECGEDGPPYIWDPERRFQLQSELDAAFFHLYGVARDDVAYIFSTFDALERADMRQHRSFRTRDRVLEIYDALAKSAATGRPYVSPLEPPRRAEPVEEPQQCGQVIPLPTRPRPQPVPVPIPYVVPDLALVAANAWARSHQHNEVANALLAVLKAHGAPMVRQDARLAALVTLEPHLLTLMLEGTERANWIRVVGSDATQPVHASVNATTSAWGAAVTGLRGRGRLVEDGDTWAFGESVAAELTAGWPEGRAGFVVAVIQRLRASESLDTLHQKLPDNVLQWVRHAA